MPELVKMPKTYVSKLTKNPLLKIFLLTAEAIVLAPIDMASRIPPTIKTLLDVFKRNKDPKIVENRDFINKRIFQERKKYMDSKDLIEQVFIMGRFIVSKALAMITIGVSIGVLLEYPVLISYAAIAPAFKTPQDLSNTRPNKLQQEFLKVAAQNTPKYFLFGDTDHRKASIRLFVRDKDVLNILENKGFHNFMIESEPDRSSIIQRIKKKDKDSLTLSYNFVSGWTTMPKQAAAEAEAFMHAVQNHPNINVIPVDTRLSEEGDENIKLFELLTIPSAPAGWIQERIYGYIDFESYLRPSTPLLALSDLFLKESDPLVDDRITSNKIKYTQGKGCIFYGAGHFSTNPHSMKKLLDQDSTHINLLANKDQDRLDKIYTPDAYLVTGTDKGDDGIIAVSNKAKEWKKLAIKNTHLNNG